MTDAEFLEKLKELRVRLEEGVKSARERSRRWDALVGELEQMVPDCLGRRRFQCGIPKEPDSQLGMMQQAQGIGGRQELVKPTFLTPCEAARELTRELVSEYVGSWGLEGVK